MSGGKVSRYRHEVIKVADGYTYRILEGSREVIRSGGFHYVRDADAVGRHFASDNDLEASLRR